MIRTPPYAQRLPLGVPAGASDGRLRPSQAAVHSRPPKLSVPGSPSVVLIPTITARSLARFARSNATACSAA